MTDQKYENLLKAVRALVAHTLLGTEFNIPSTLLINLSAPIYGDVLKELTILDGVDKYDADEIFIWLLDYMKDTVQETRDNDSSFGRLVSSLMQKLIVSMLEGLDEDEHPTLVAKIQELTGERKDLSLWEDALDDINDG